jgi:3-oxoacyl-[acyl-carrier-protein] synthase II
MSEIDRAAAIVGYGALSAFGEGREALGLVEAGLPARTAIGVDEALASAGVQRPFGARIDARPQPTSRLDEEDPALGWLRRAWSALPLGALLAQGTSAPLRIGLALGTSSGAMRSAERLFERWIAAGGRDDGIDRALLDGARYGAPFDACRSWLPRPPTRSVHVLSACAASTLAIGIGARWIEADACDAVIAGGYDAATTFVGAGFSALGAITATPPPRPLSPHRDGMALGEGAGLLLLVKPALAATLPRPLGWIGGFGAACDAVHLTAPARDGRGAAAAARRALGRAAPDLVSLHGTSTAYNDCAEDAALRTVLGAAVGEVPVVASKSSLGHTLGAAGVLETLAALESMAMRLVPPTAGYGEQDPALAMRARATAEASNPRRLLKLSSAFGGTNAALRVDLDRPPPMRRARAGSRRVAEVEVSATVTAATLAAATALPRERLARLDESSLLTLWAASELARAVGEDALRGAGAVVASALCTMGWNARYHEPIARGEAARVEGRRFAYTTPNAAVGELAMAYGLTGPCLAVGGTADAAAQGRAVVADLLAAGDARAMLLIEVEPETRLGAAVLAAMRDAPAFGARASLWLAEPE